MTAIEKAINQIHQSAISQSSEDRALVDVRIYTVVTLVFMVVTLSMPIADPAKLIWLFVYPIVMAEASGIGYLRLFLKSLWILPIVLVIGIFNPWIDTSQVWTIGGITIDRGWLTFASLVLRGLLTFQGLLLLIYSYGFYDICRCLQALKCPKILVTQLLMLHRYIGVLLHEALNMQRARQARGYGKTHYPLRMWGVMAGQLLIRSIQRAHRVNNAMVARGFTGVYHFKPYSAGPRIKDYLYAGIWVILFVALRWIDFTAIVAKVIVR